MSEDIFLIEEMVGTTIIGSLKQRQNIAWVFTETLHYPISKRCLNDPIDKKNEQKHFYNDVVIWNHESS